MLTSLRMMTVPMACIVPPMASILMPSGSVTIVFMLGLALEQVADDRKLAENRNRGRVVLPEVVEQTGDRERLAVAQLHVGLGAARD